MMGDIIPKLDKGSFKCPHCNVLTTQEWRDIKINMEKKYVESHKAVEYNMPMPGMPPHYNWLYRYATCHNCGGISIWFRDEMIYPLTGTTPDPNKDMPDKIMEIFNEARNISNISPRASVALLRLCVEQLVNQLDKGKGSLNDKIKRLVEKELSKEVQQALDLVRVSGNNAIHPGEISLDDNNEHIEMLFKTINIIVERTISSKNQIQDAYNKLPSKDIKSIQDRDQNSQ